jgi:hypothetical protein
MKAWIFGFFWGWGGKKYFVIYWIRTLNHSPRYIVLSIYKSWQITRWILLSELSSSPILESKSISIPFLELEGFGIPQSLKPLGMARGFVYLHFYGPKLKCPITPMYLMEKFVEISTMLIVYCNPSLCEELWVKWLPYMVRLSMTAWQGFLFFNLAMLRKCKKIDGFFQKEKKLNLH